MEARKDERRSVVASGKTVDDAIIAGLNMLGVHRDEVDVEILNEGSRGVLGFGAANAQVKLLVKLAPEPEPAKPLPEPMPVPASEPALGPALEPTPPSPGVEGEEAEPEDSTAEYAGRKVLAEILKLMGIRASVESKLGYELADEGQPPPVVLNITGDDLGILIGRRGETLRALQYLVRLMVSHRLKQWTNLIVDVENYRVRRRQSLESLAHRVAERVVQTGRSQALEPMPAYERRIVHITLRADPKVMTESVGEGERRKVTIIPKK